MMNGAGTSSAARTRHPAETTLPLYRRFIAFRSRKRAYRRSALPLVNVSEWNQSVDANACGPLTAYRESIDGCFIECAWARGCSRTGRKWSRHAASRSIRSSRAGHPRRAPLCPSARFRPQCVSRARPVCWGRVPATALRAASPSPHSKAPSAHPDSI